jgi:hypothetical protein
MQRRATGLIVSRPPASNQRVPRLPRVGHDTATIGAALVWYRLAAIGPVLVDRLEEELVVHYNVACVVEVEDDVGCLARIRDRLRYVGAIAEGRKLVQPNSFVVSVADVGERVAVAAHG